MDNQRLLIWGLFGFLAWITYQTWLQDYTPDPVTQAAQAVNQPDLTVPGDGDDLPQLGAPADGTIDAPLPTDIVAPEPMPAASTAPTVRVVTDVLDVEISLQGATLQSAVMSGYPVAKDNPDTLIQLLSTDPSNYGAIQTGLRIAGEGDEPNHRAMFVSGSSTYELGNDETLLVPFQWMVRTVSVLRSASGLRAAHTPWSLSRK